MTKRFFIILTCLALTIPAIPQTTFTHPWKGKRVAYLGDSITDPRNSGAKKKYWGFLQDWLDITPFVYGISGRQWNDIPNQADKLHNEHGDDVDAILIPTLEVDGHLDCLWLVSFQSDDERIHVRVRGSHLPEADGILFLEFEAVLQGFLD